MTLNQKVTFLIIVLSSSFSIGAVSQVLVSKHKTIKISEFVTDSMSTYNTRYVKYGAVSNIKLSQYPIEIRLFSYSMSSEIIDLKIIQANTDSAYITNKRIWIANKSGIPNYTKIFEGDTFSVNVAERQIKKTVNYYADFFKELKQNNLFAIKGEDDSKKFISNEKYNVEDGNSTVFIEVKIDSFFRNFTYFFSGGLDDPDRMRHKHMSRIIKLIDSTLSTKQK